MSPAAMTGNPSVAVMVVSDYGGRTAEDWRYLRNTLSGLRDQKFDGDLDVVLIDTTPADEPMPPELMDVVPGMRAVGASDDKPADLLNEAVRASTAEHVVFLDGDCVPAPGWLQAAVDALKSQPQCAAASGRTEYADNGFTSRVLTTLSRSFVDPGGPGPTNFISGNNAIYRRDAFLAHPLASLARPFAARLQSEEMRRAGAKLYFEPRMRVTHRFEGWPMERRIRRSVGYATIRLRQLDPRMPHAWMLRLGVLSIPLILGARTVDSFWDCVRAGPSYGLRWFELPAAFVTAVAVHLLEIRGMLEAFAEARPASRRLQG
jgi:hypothetical protein